MRSPRLAMAVQLSLFGTIAMEIGAAHSLNDLSFSVKTQTKSVLKILVLAIPKPPGGPQWATYRYSLRLSVRFRTRSSVRGRGPAFPPGGVYAIVAPPATLKAITEKINADVNEALRQPELQDRLRKLSAETFGGSAKKAAKYMREEVERWSEVIEAADIKLQ